METIEPKLGEVINYEGVFLKCVEGNCFGCFFAGDDSDCTEFECRGRLRKDGKEVRFRKASNDIETRIAETLVLITRCDNLITEVNGLMNEITGLLEKSKQILEDEKN